MPDVRNRQTQETRYLPLAIDMEGLRCLVVGGGRVGVRKAMTLADAGAVVTVLAPEVNDRLLPAVESARVTWLRDTWPMDDATDYTLVVAATDDPSLNIEIAEHVHARGGLACVVSPGRFSRVIFPAVHRTDGVTVAVHSDGRDCGRSRKLRNHIAAALERRERPPVLPAVLGVKRNMVPHQVFRKLSEGALPGARGAGWVVLATCQRWEVHFSSHSPRGTARELRSTIHQKRGVMLEAHPEAVYLLTGAAAVHHLVRVASGLDSPLLGETEIVGQIRSALPGEAPSEAGVQEMFPAVLRAQKVIRKQSGLRPNGSWAGAALGRLQSTGRSLRGRTVVIVGCGRLGEAIAERLVDRRARVVPVSRRATGAGVPWCDRLGLRAVSPEVLAGEPGRAAAIVLTIELASEPLEYVRELAADDSTIVVDLADAHRKELSPLMPGRYFGVFETGRTPLSGARAAACARAERLAVEHALRLFRDRCTVPTPPPIRLGGRGSRLSIEQLSEVRSYLAQLAPSAGIETVTLDVPCDRDRRTPLPEVKEDDFFTRDLDEALLGGKIDVAVHSAKDLPGELRDGLVVAALTPSLASWDALVTRDGSGLEDLPAGARIGTSSERRREGILRLRSDMTPTGIRGNVPARLEKLERGEYDALVLGAVGLIRLGEEERIGRVFASDELPTAPGQGALALVVREEDRRLRRFLEPLDLGDRGVMPW
ncbi:MAG: hydroxymethylbilane synthase [Candidatus Brocadiia bacterium]